jgi:hypothetical protein
VTVINLIAMIADRLITAPTERSYTPAASGISTASASMAATDFDDATECSVAEVRNRFGRQIPKRTTKPAHRYSPLHV